MIKLRQIIIENIINEVEKHITYLLKRAKKLGRKDYIEKLKKIDTSKEPYTTLLKDLKYFYDSNSEPIKKAYFSQILMSLLIEEIVFDIITKHKRNIKKHLKLTGDPDKDFEIFYNKNNIVRNNEFYYDSIPEVRELLHPENIIGDSPNYINYD